VGVPRTVVLVVRRAMLLVVVLTRSDGSGLAGWAIGVGPPGGLVEPDVEPRAGVHAPTSAIAHNTTARR
jgi:hypothetical protein